MSIIKLLSDLLSGPVVAIYISILFPFISPTGFGSLSMFQTIIVSLMFLGIIPILPWAYMMRKGMTDFDVTERRMRTPLYMFAALNYAILAVILYFTGAGFMFVVAMSYFLTTALILIINLFWKVSVHTAGISGPITALVYVFGFFLLPLYILTIIVVWIRWKLRAHTQMQLFVGALVGILSAYLSFFLFY